MSTLAYAAMTHARLAAEPDKPIKPDSPGIKTYVDALAALVPAEVLAAHATILTFTTKTDNGTVSITGGPALGIAFYALIGLSVVLYVGGRLMTAKWDAWDYVRSLIPPLAFVGWTMLQKATAFDAVAGNSLDEATRNVIALIGGVVLGVGAAALAYKADATPAP
jgi:hypothetical protein